ncbi:MAG: hypothetical protein AB7V19_07090 [Candidatus Bipolaricaulia bacterium]
MDAAATRALVQSRHEAIRASITLSGGVQALDRAGTKIEALQQVVVEGIRLGVIKMPKTPEDLGRLLNRWLMAARDENVALAAELKETSARLTARASTITRVLSDAGPDNVVVLPTPEPPAQRGKVRRRRKKA